MIRWRYVLKIVIGSVIILVVAVLLIGLVPFVSWVKSPSPEEMIRDQTNEDIQTAQIHPGKSTSTIISTVCGSFLADAMRKNNNRYSVVVIGIWGDYGTPLPGGTGSTEAVVNVVFPNGTRAYMHYYLRILIGCGEII